MNKPSVRFLISLLLAAPSLAPIVQGPARSEHRLRVRTDLVELFLTAKRGNRLVSGLEAGDFEIFEDGAPRQLAFLERTEEPLRVALLLDSSGSMQETMPDLQRAAIQFIDSLRPEDQLAVIAFGGSVKVLAKLTDQRSDAVQGVIQLRPEGSTRLYDAVIDSLLLLEQVQGRTAIVLFTDGTDTASQMAPEAVLKRLGRSAAPLFALGTGEALDHHSRRSLKELAGKTGGEAYFVKRGRDYPKAFASISEILRTSYRGGYYLSGPLDGSWRKISARLKSGAGEVATRPGFYAN